MKKYSYNILNLDCSNCARRIEDELNKNKLFKDVVVNFGTSKISFYADEISLDGINKIISKIEPDVYVCDDENVERPKQYHILPFVIGLLIGFIGLFVPINEIFNKILIITSYIIFLYRPFVNAFKMLIRGSGINENALIFISCVGAFLVGEVHEGLMVVVLYTIGKILEEKALNSTRNSIQSLMEIKQDYANLKKGKSTVKIKVSEVKKGDCLIVDGVLSNKEATLDMSVLTGEAESVSLKKGDNVLSGSINLGDVITMKATDIYENSTVSRILKLTLSAADKKARTETLVTRFSKIYTPIVLGLAILVAILLPIIPSITYGESIYRALTFLVIACPCAIAISVPLAYFTGIGTSSKNGILIKGSNFLDNLSKIKKIIFDKTGTLTTGSFKVVDVKILDKSYNKDEVMRILASGEVFSNHPIAKAILKEYKGKLCDDKVSNYKEISGVGIEYDFEGKKVKAGSASICNDNYEDGIHLNIDGKHIALIIVDDGIKESAAKTIQKLKKLGIKTLMFTGDKKDISLNIGKKIMVDEVRYEMLPEDKYNQYEKEANCMTAFVGDGINDAPVIKRADIGIAMGAIGSSSAIEASDVVIMNDDLMQIPKAIEISKYTGFIIKQNLIFAIGVKVIILLLSIVGIATMWFAVFADTGVTLLTIVNTLRIMKKFSKK